MEKKKLRFSNGVEIQVEVAESYTDRMQGLMHRTSLDENQGMLFDFKRPQILSFWMKNTYIPLSIGYFDKNKKLKEIYQMKAQAMMARDQDLRSYPSRCRCVYALEVNQGWFKKNKIKPEMTFEIHQLKDQNQKK